MRPEDLRAFAQRDWASAQRAKLEHWVRQCDTKGVLSVIQVADALRVQVQRFSTEPIEQGRALDLAHHVLLKQRIDAASHWFRR